MLLDLIKDLENNKEILVKLIKLKKKNYYTYKLKNAFKNSLIREKLKELLEIILKMKFLFLTNHKLLERDQI